ncbi:MAG: S9 family peptidase [Conexivisphaerales archaeon]
MESLFSVPSVVEFDVSRRLPYVAYITNRTGQWQLMLLDSSKGADIQLTFDDNSKFGPKFSPDGKSLLFVKDTEGNEKFDIFLTDLDTRSVINLTPDTDYAIYPNPMFSPDGKRITYVSNQNGLFSSFMMNIEDKTVHRLTGHNYSDHFCEISPTGDLAVVASQVDAQENNIFIVHLEDDKAELERLLDPKGNVIEADEPSWSPDGKKLAFVSSSLGWYDIGIWEINEKEVTWITEGGFECHDPVFSPDGRFIAYLRNTGTDVVLELFDLINKERKEVNFKRGVVSSPRFANSKELYFIFSSARNPPDLWMYSIDKSEFSQLTRSLPEDVDVSMFVDGEPVQYQNEKDKRPVPAVLYKPIKKGMRAVIEIHGGPTAQALNSWNPFVQFLVSSGFAVLRPNYRGSTGFGKEHREANRYVMGDLDLADCVSGYSYLIKQGLAQEGRVAVAGGSFGGYLTMCALTKYPTLWSCGVAIVPFLNWFTEIKNEREDLRFWDLQNMGDPDKPEDRERLKQASPIFFIKDIVAPVLLIAGANDPRCPVEEAEQAKEELEKNGKLVETRFYSDEGHGFRKTANRIDAYKRAIDFIEKYTKT